MPHNESLTATSATILDLDDIQARYDIGKTKAYEVVSDPGFINSMVAGMHRYPAAALEAYELGVSLAGTVADPATAVRPTSVVITPPALGRPGPKAKSPSARKAA